MNTYRVWFTIPESDYPLVETMQSPNLDLLAYYLDGALNVNKIEALSEWTN